MTQTIYKFIIKAIATGLGTGYSPIIPGTIATMLGIPLYFLISKLNPFVYWIIIVLLFLIGVFTATKAEKMFGTKDSKQIVIDEIVCYSFFLLLVPCTKWCIILGFIVFRVFDIIKPFPAYRSQSLPGGWGIMVDDLIAAIYTVIVIHTAMWITPLREFLLRK
jgi:phosphatidylglycerophosphatase A